MLRLADPTISNVGYVVEHMREIDAREIYACRFDDSSDRLIMDVLQRWSIAWVAGAERPIAVLGGVELWPGTWSIGMFATDEFPIIGRELTRWVRQRMIPTLHELGLHRAEANSIEGHDLAHRWMKHLGARMEDTPMRKFGKGGETFFKFVWEF